MKKAILLVGVLALLAIGFATTSCEKSGGSIANGCDCTYKYMGITSDPEYFDKEACEAVGASTCKELANWCADNSLNIGTWTCKSH